jgi:hypothetical protein
MIQRRRRGLRGFKNGFPTRFGFAWESRAGASLDGFSIAQTYDIQFRPATIAAKNGTTTLTARRGALAWNCSFSILLCWVPGS